MPETEPVTPPLERRTLMALVDASRAINAELDLPEVFNRIVEWAASVLDAEAASVLLFDGERHELAFKAVVGSSSRQLVGVRFDANLGIAGQCVKQGRAMRVDDVRRNRHFFPGIDAQTHMRTESLIAAPMAHGGAVLGVIEVINPRGRTHFTNRDVELATVFANLASAAANHAQAFDRVSRQNRALQATQPREELVGTSEAARHAVQLCRKVAAANATVLLYGETGTGKEIAARMIQGYSERSDKPFVAINCAALPESLLESELFGHEKGAFTGATGQKPGRFELADGGTLFLDEIGELSPAIQVKLLRVLQEREYVRVGGTQTLTCDVRIIAATNRDLREEMQAGRFREDLFYRLNVFPIHLPPLRDRIEDLPALVEHFVHRIAPTLGVEPPVIEDRTLQALMTYHWPGNARELRNVVERCTLLAGGDRVTPEHLPPEIQQADRSAASASGAGAGAAEERLVVSTGSKLADHERTLIVKALEDHRWNQSAAARALGISRDHLRYRVKKYGLRKPSG